MYLIYIMQRIPLLHIRTASANIHNNNVFKSYLSRLDKFFFNSPKFLFFLSIDWLEKNLLGYISWQTVLLLPFSLKQRSKYQELLFNSSKLGRLPTLTTPAFKSWMVSLYLSSALTQAVYIYMY